MPLGQHSYLDAVAVSESIRMCRGDREGLLAARFKHVEIVASLLTLIPALNKLQ